MVAEQSFDAWGRRRNESGWTYSTLGTTPDWLHRGYTGHEHYEEFALGVGVVRGLFTNKNSTFNLNYVNYNNSNHINSLDKIRIFTRWYDDASWVIPVLGPVGVGIYNSFKDKP